MKTQQNDNPVKSFTGLTVWQEGHRLVLDVYRITRQFPAEERFGLSSQIQRAVVSVTSNIAEGFSRSSAKEKIQFYYMALSSLTEAQNQLLIAKDLSYVSKLEFTKLADQTILVSKLTNGLIRSIKQRITK